MVRIGAGAEVFFFRELNAVNYELFMNYSTIIEWNVCGQTVPVQTHMLVGEYHDSSIKLPVQIGHLPVAFMDKSVFMVLFFNLCRTGD